MPKAPYKFSIVSGTFQYYSIVGGMISTSPTEIVMKSGILDWKTLSLNYKRDSIFWGIIRGYAPQRIKFVKDAARILRWIKNTQGGSEAKAYLAVSLLNKSTQQYDFLDFWQFDFSVTSNQLNYYEVAIMEGGLSARIKAFASQKYSIPLNDPALAPGLSGRLADIDSFPLYNTLPADEIPLVYPASWNEPIAPPVPYLVFMDGIPIFSDAQFVTTNDPGGGPVGETILIDGTDIGLGNGKTIGMVNSLIIGDYLSTVGMINNPMTHMGIGHDDVANTVLFTASHFRGCKIKIKYDLNFTWNNGAGSGTDKLILFYNIHTGVPSGTWGADLGNTPIITDVPLAGGGTRNVRWKGETDYITILPDKLLSIGFGGSNGAATLISVEIPRTDVLNPLPVIILDTQFIPDSSVNRAITYWQLLQQMTAYVATNGGALESPLTTDPATWTKSDLLQNDRDPSAAGNWDLNLRNTMITSGDALRGLKTVTIVDPAFNGGLPFDQWVQPAIYTSLQDIAKDLFTDACAGIGVERDGIGTDKLVIEGLEYFLDDNVIIADLGDDIANFEMIDFNDYKGSMIIIGQNDQQFDSINGPYETISEVEYSLPSVRTIKQIDNKTTLRADPYGIEITRANIGNKTNTNSSSDNDTFKIQVKDLLPDTLALLEQWGGISGYEPIVAGYVAVDALKLQRAIDIYSGLPAGLLTPEVGGYAMYNQVFSPQRKALRSLPWLTSNYRGLVDKLMGITGKKKNIMLRSNLGAGEVDESNWINLSDADQTYTPPYSTTPITVHPAPIIPGRTSAMLFKPIIFSFTGPAIKGLPKLMTPPGTIGGGKMYGKVKFRFKRGAEVLDGAGFVMDIGMFPGTNAAWTYKLLCSPSVVIPDYM